MKQDISSKQSRAAYDNGWSRAGSFFESIIAGSLIGYLLDMWLGTEPWLVITGVVLGSYTGFMRIWAMLKEQDLQDRER